MSKIEEIQNRFAEDGIKFFVTKLLKGGEGSGNFGHEGRPGEIGGSGEGGSDSKHEENNESENTDNVTVSPNESSAIKPNRSPAKVNIHSIERSKYLQRENQGNETGFIVTAPGFDRDGNLETESLSQRGYKFNKDHVKLGKNVWSKSFRTEQEADNEMEALY